ncbi:MAG TPA: hypothetical protein VGS22_15960 [Thermoanaerobaculia bacterium]|jgi:hypothetical protein|nr:hypothetical protein [Thermoanaerobaculia bacterium]
MKKLSSAAFIFLVVLAAMRVIAQSEPAGSTGEAAAALNSFKALAEGFPALFRADSQVVLQNSGGYVLQNLEAVEVSYDVRRTDSLVSPFVGEVTFILRWNYFTTCSPQHMAALQKWMRGEGGDWPPEETCAPGPSTAEEAKEKAPNTSEDKKAVARYSYQAGSWVPKQVEVRSYIQRGKETSEVYTSDKRSGWPLLDSVMTRFFEPSATAMP